MDAERKGVLVNGFVAGLLGYGATALFFAVLNAAQGHSPLHTPALLGAWLFYGAADPGASSVEPGPILAYNGLHLAAFLLLGVLGAAVASVVERRPLSMTPALVLVLGFVLLTTAMLLVLMAPVAAQLPWWSIGAANLLAVGAMGGYLAWAHPRLRAELRLFPAGDVHRPAGKQLAEAGSMSRYIDSLVWAASRPAPPKMTDPREAATGDQPEIRLLHCSALGRDVRLAWTPPSARQGREPLAPPGSASDVKRPAGLEAEEDGAVYDHETPDDFEVVCLDYGAACTDPICPLFGLPPYAMGARLRQTGL